MHWIWLTAGLLLLVTVWVINHFISGRKASPAGSAFRYRRLKRPSRCLQLLKKSLHLQDDLPAVTALQDCVPMLMADLRRLASQMRSMPALPAGEDHQPRLMLLALELSDEEQYTAPELLHALASWEAFSCTSSEVDQLPLCIASAQCQRLQRVVRSIHSDVQEHRAAHRRCRQFRHSKDPQRLMNRHPLSSVGLASLRRICLQQDSKLLSTIDAWLLAQGITPEALIQHDRERQSQLIEELHRALDCFSRIERLSWTVHCETVDPLHPLFLQDPSDTYPRLDAASRRYLRRQAEVFSRRTRMDACQVLQQALALSLSSQDSTPEGCLCWYFQEAEGLIHLHRTLPCRRGWLWARLSRKTGRLSYAFLLLFGFLTGFFFLQSRQPVFVLPFFAFVTGCISRSFLRLIPPQPMLHMTLPPLTDNLRTLVVLPADMPDPAAAMKAVQAVKTTLKFLPEDAHLLLLGDFAPSITPATAGDAAIIHAAATGLEGLTDPRVHYMHRHRVWDSTQHCYCRLGGSSGVALELCRMLTGGKAELPLAYSTTAPASFERQYAYLFLLSARQLPSPGLLEQLLCVMISPLCTRLPTPKRWRGVSILSPQGWSFSEGMALLQPDAFLEATDGLVQPDPSADALCEALSGHVCVPGVRVRQANLPSAWADHCERASRSWRLLPWQLSHVQTPSGLISNPLRFLSRFRLRESIRATLVPLGRIVLLVWAILTNSWPLLLTGLVAPEVGNPLRNKADWLHVFGRLSLLPMLVTVNLLGAYRAFFRKRLMNPDFSSIEVWVQGISATIFAALGIALPGGSLPSLALAAVFAAFPLAHRYE